MSAHGAAAVEGSGWPGSVACGRCRPLKAATHAVPFTRGVLFMCEEHARGFYGVRVLPEGFTVPFESMAPVRL